MKMNEGFLDRGLRIVIGVGLVGLSATGVIGLWGYLGAMPALTGMSGYCPLYALLGIDTCATRSERRRSKP